MSIRPSIVLLLVSACVSRAAEPAAAPVAFAPQRAADRAPDPVLAGADGRVSVTVGALDRQPEIDGFIAELERNAGHLQRCWDARAAVASAGDIVIHFHVGPDGAVVEQCVSEDTVGDAEVRRCANDLIAMGRYPARSETVDVVVPLRFTPPNG